MNFILLTIFLCVSPSLSELRKEFLPFRKRQNIFSKLRKRHIDDGEYLEQCAIVNFTNGPNFGKVNVLAFLDATWQYSHRQAVMLKDLKGRFERFGLVDINFFVINSMTTAITQPMEIDVERKTWMTINSSEVEDFSLLELSVETLKETLGDEIFFIQDNLDLDIWKKLHVSRDQIVVVDGCGQLTYQVIVPWSILHFPYVKAAILSTFNDEPCGPCEVNNFEEIDVNEPINDEVPISTRINYEKTVFEESTTENIDGKKEFTDITEGILTITAKTTTEATKAKDEAKVVTETLKAAAKEEETATEATEEEEKTTTDASKVTEKEEKITEVTIATKEKVKTTTEATKAAERVEETTEIIQTTEEEETKTEVTKAAEKVETTTEIIQTTEETKIETTKVTEEKEKTTTEATKAAEKVKATTEILQTTEEEETKTEATKATEEKEKSTTEATKAAEKVKATTEILQTTEEEETKTEATKATEEKEKTTTEATKAAEKVETTTKIIQMTEETMTEATKAAEKVETTTEIIQTTEEEEIKTEATKATEKKEKSTTDTTEAIEKEKTTTEATKTTEKIQETTEIIQATEEEEEETNTKVTKASEEKEETTTEATKTTEEQETTTEVTKTTEEGETKTEATNYDVNAKEEMENNKLTDNVEVTEVTNLFEKLEATVTKIETEVAEEMETSTNFFKDEKFYHIQSLQKTSSTLDIGKNQSKLPNVRSIGNSKIDEISWQKLQKLENKNYSDSSSSIKKFTFPIRVIMKAPHLDIRENSLVKHDYLILKTNDKNYHEHFDKGIKIELPMKNFNFTKNNNDADNLEKIIDILNIENHQLLNNQNFPPNENQTSGKNNNNNKYESNKLKFSINHRNVNQEKEKIDKTIFGKDESPGIFDTLARDDFEIIDTEKPDYDLIYEEIDSKNLENYEEEEKNVEYSVNEKEEKAKIKLIEHYSKLLSWIHYVLN